MTPGTVLSVLNALTHLGFARTTRYGCYCNPLSTDVETEELSSLPSSTQQLNCRDLNPGKSDLRVHKLNLYTTQEARKILLARGKPKR